MYERGQFVSGQSVFEWVKELEWTCPKCAEVYVTALLNPMCRNCGYKETG